MKLQQRLIFSVTVLGLCCSMAIAQDPVFNHYTVDDGLPQNSVNCILQDSKGFMWFGTQAGLCRFDGYNFKIFRHEPGKNSLSNNYIWNIYEDKEDILWITTFGGGLNRYDPSTETFTNYKREKNDAGLSNNNTFAIVEVNNILWIGTDDGFCSLDKRSGTIKRYLQTPGNEKGISANHIGTIAYQKEGFLWMNSNSGLTRLNIATEEIKFFGKKIFGSAFDIKTIMKIRSSGNKLLIACDTGLVEINPVMQTAKILLPAASVKTEKKALFRDVLPLPGDKYCISTDQGLLFYNHLTNQHTLYQHSSNPSSLTHNMVLCAFRSSSGIFWIGTRSGLNKLDHEKKQFDIIRKSQSDPNTLSNKYITCLLQDHTGLVWAGTPDGLNVFDRKTQKFKIFKSSEQENSISSNYILSLLEQDDGTLWIGTRGGGLNKLVRKNGAEISSVGFQRHNIGNKTIQHICKGDSNILWLGSSGGSLIRFNSRTGKTKELTWKQDGTGPSHPFVFYIFIDSYGNKWLGTAAGGLNLFDEKSERFIYLKNETDNYNSLSNNMVLTLFEDNKHRLWVGTAGGLNRLLVPLKPDLFSYFKSNVNAEKDSLFVRYGIQDGLPNDVIYGMLQDKKNNIWISTNKGLVKFSASSKPVCKTYDPKDGIQNNEFSQNAFYQNSGGEFYFGGADGFNIFHPDSIKENRNIPPVVITDFRLYNESVKVGDKGKFNFSLKKSITYTDEIRLAYHHNVISFQFAALNYINTEKNRYQYKLEGFDKNWVDAGDNRFATYTNLDAGNYTFRVRGSNNDGVWNEKGAAVRLIVPPPPWLSWYAYLAYFLAATFAGYYFIRQREKTAKRKYEAEAAIERAKAEERESFRKKSSQDFHDEAGNKITRINLFTELAKSEAGENAGLKNYLDKIYHNTAALSSGMRDFIWAMDPAKDTVFETILRMKEFGDSMFTDACVSFTLAGLQPSTHDLKLPMDIRRAMVQIFKEAMNNCAKHAKASSVLLSIEINSNVLIIKLTDNGNGFDMQSAKNSKGYGLGIMKERAQKAGAELLIYSEKEKGAEITLRCNIPQVGD